MKCFVCGDEIPYSYMITDEYVTGICQVCDPEAQEEVQ